MTRFDTPRDRPTIEHIKDVYFLSGLNYYRSLRPYFEPKSKSVVFESDDDEPECYPHLVPFYILFDIPEGHLLEYVWDWAEKIDHLEACDQIPKILRESFNALILLDSELVKPHRNPKYENKTTVWSCRFSGLLKGEARGLSESQRQALLVFIQDCKDEYLEDLDKFYVPSVDVNLDDR